MDLLPQPTSMLTGGIVVLGVLTWHLVHPMVLTDPVSILLVIQCLEFPFLLTIAALPNRMQFLLVVLYTGLLELFLMFHSQVARVLGPGANAPIGSHFSHQQASQQPIGSHGPIFNFPALENPNTQPSVGGLLSQPGYASNMAVQGPSQTFRDGFSMDGMSQAFLGDDFKSQGSHVPYNVADFSTQASQSGFAVDYVNQGAQAGFPGNFLNQISQAGYSHYGSGNEFISQDYMAHGSQGLFTQAGYNDPSQDDSSQNQFGMSNANPLQSQSLLNPLYSQPFATTPNR